MKNLILVAFMIFASVAMAADQGRDDDVKPFIPAQDTIKVMNHVFEVLR